MLKPLRSQLLAGKCSVRQRSATKSLPSPVRGNSGAIGVFARTPVPGKAKTRLIPLLGREGAAEFQAGLISDAVRKVSVLGSSRESITPYLFLAASTHPNRSRGDPGASNLPVLRQRGANLGVRLERAFRQLFRRHAAAIIIGTDSPLLPFKVLRAALKELRTCEAVLGPCPDGGYYLIGLRATSLGALSTRKPATAVPSSPSGPRRGRARRVSASAGIFRRVRWGSGSAFRDTLRNLLDAGLSCSILEPFPDVDRPEDVRRLKRQLAYSPAARRLAPATWNFLTRCGKNPRTMSS